MKIIDAIWEKRNLGVSCTELIIENKDDLQSVEKQLREINSQYQVVKIPVKRIELARLLSSYKFTCFETLFELKYRFNDSSLFKDMKSDIQYSPMDGSNLEFLNRQIQKGMFNSDRVALDHNFSEEQASNRYLGWIKDELNMGAKVFKNTFNGNQVGFFGIREISEGVFHQFLIGLYPEHQGKGMGSSLIKNAINYVREQGASQFSTAVSSNNFASFKLHLSCGFLPDSACYVYTKYDMDKGS